MRLLATIATGLCAALVVGCASPTPTNPPNPTQPPSPTPAASTSVSTGVPAGATAGVDQTSRDLVARIRARSFGPDVVAAVTEALARSGIASVADPSAAPDKQVATPVSPDQLLDWQTSNIALGAWAANGPTGADLDALMPIPPQEADSIPPVSAIVAGYVAAVDTPGAALARALMADQDLNHPTTVTFPLLVLELFASDIAVDNQATASSSGLLLRPPAAAPVAALAVYRQGTPAAAAPAAFAPCSAVDNFFNNVIHTLFSALYAATPDNVVGAVIVSVWNWLVSKAEAFVHALVNAVTDQVKAIIRDIVAAIATAVHTVSAFLPYAVRVAPQPGQIELPIDPASAITGHVAVTVTAGPALQWPGWMADCAQSAGTTLPSTAVKGSQVDWSMESQGLYVIEDGGPGKLDANGTATLDFHSVVEPADRKDGQRQHATVTARVSVERQDLADARKQVGDFLFSKIPTILRGFVSAIFRPYIDDILRKIDSLLDAKGSGTLDIIYHAPPSPTPSTPEAASVAPTGRQTPRAIPLPDACTLVTANDVAGLIGASVASEPMTDSLVDPSTQSGCNYIVNGGSSGAIKLFVADPGTLEGIVANLPVEPVGGLGDSAYQWDIGSTHTLAVAVGAVVLQAQLSTKFYDPRVTNSMLGIAISRLGR
jgi:hypothetical protein